MEWAGSPSILGNTAQLPLLTLAIAAQQFAWGVEQAYVSRYLLQLGISKPHLSLVWIAGPLCGLVVQPVIGAISDFSRYKHGRRRPYMMSSAIAVAIGMIIFSTAEDSGAYWQISPLIPAIVGVLIVDVFINVCGATSRALIVDSLPRVRQNSANAWAGRMSAGGHLASYWLCSADIAWIMGTQIKSVCFVASFLLVLGVGLTCGAVNERYLVNRPTSAWNQVKRVFTSTFKAAFNLDSVLASIFKVQLFGWYAWFTLLFFGAEWAAEVWKSTQVDPTPDQIARAGSRALLIFSISTTCWSLVLPLLKTSIVKLWSGSYIVYAIAAFASFWVSTYTGVLAIFSVIGIAWAMTCWAPFALTAERIHEMPHSEVQEDPQGEILVVNEDYNESLDTVGEKSGVYLGLHNTSITLPQFLSTFGSWLVFRIMDNADKNGSAIAVALQVGSFTALLAAYYATKVNKVWDSVVPDRMREQSPEL